MIQTAAGRGSTAGLVVLRRLAEHTATLSADALGREAVERVGWCVLDLFGCFLGARRLGVNRVLFDLVEPAERGATLWGTRRRVPAEQAALVAGTVAHHLELDGGWHGPPGVGAHPAVTVIPAALAVAEEIGASGREVVAAIAAGYDVIAVLATWLCPGITAFRLHPPSLLGAFGATAAVGRLLGLGPDRTAGALAWCAGVAPLSPFEAFTGGASAKDLYGGWPGFIGVNLARAKPPKEAWFGLDRLLGRDEVDPAPALEQLREPAVLHADFKPYPTCRSVQPALTALEALLTERAIEPARVAAIEVETYPYAAELDESAVEETPIGARTSIRACLALRLLRGPLRPEHFTPVALGDAEVRRLAEATTVSVGRYADGGGRGAVVRLQLDDGERVEQGVAAAKWSPEQPATTDELRAKFRSFAVPVVAARAAAALEERTLGLVVLRDVGALFEVLDIGEARGPGAATCPAGAQASEELVERVRSALPTIYERLSERGAQPAALAGVVTAVDSAASRVGLDAAARARALSIALCLVPSGAGPVPLDWGQMLGAWAVRLAQAGFSGPPGVLDGPRGLHRLLLPNDE